jgi:Ran GTPase-activating protein (RanGAP) involved in mRNA processing and transport
MFINFLGTNNTTESIYNRSPDDCATDAATINQKTDSITKKHFENRHFEKSSRNPALSEEKKTLIKLYGTKDHWISQADLESQSKVFEKMFSPANNWKENGAHELYIVNEKIGNREVIDQFIRCLETGKSPCISEENFQELLSLAHKYAVSWLVENCEQFIAANLRSDNVLSVIRDIAEPYRLPGLLKNCFIFLFNKTDPFNEDSMKEIQILGEKLQLVELKIIASLALECVSISENLPYTFDIAMSGKDLARCSKHLIEIFSKASLNDPSASKPSANLKIWIDNSYSQQLPALAEFLKSNPKSVHLELEGRGCIGAAGATRIAALLKGNEILTNLNLFLNHIGDAGAIQIAGALKENKMLTSLNLSDNHIGDAGAIQMAGALKENKILTSLDLGSNNIGDAGAIQIAGALKENKILAGLYLGNNNIGNAAAIQIAGALKENNTLANLDLGYNRIEREGATQIAAALKTNKTLTSLTLGGNQIGDEGFIQIAAALKENTALKSLSLSYNRIEREGVTQIAATLKTNKTLTDLNLTCNEIGDKGAIQIAAALKDNNTLASLDLGLNKIGDEAAIQIVTALKENTTLTSLGFWSNKIGDEGAIQIAAALKENKTLTSLNLAGNTIGDEGAIQIAAALKKNTTLTSLDLRGNKIGSAAVAMIEAALEENKMMANFELHINRAPIDSNLSSFLKFLRQMPNNLLSMISTLE